MKKNKKRVWYILIGIGLGILFFLIASLLLKKDKMSCASNEKDEFKTTNEIIEVYYTKNTVTSVVQKTKHIFNNKESLNVFKEYLDTAVENIKDKKHVRTSKNNDNLIYETSIKINVKKIDEKELINLHISNNLEDYKNILINKGFECKLEKE